MNLFGLRPYWQCVTRKLIKKTMKRRHLDQMIRTPNFRARNGRIQTGALGISEMSRREEYQRGKWENVVSGKQMDSVQEETLTNTIRAEINTVTTIKINSKTIDPHQITSITDLMNPKNKQSARNYIRYRYCRCLSSARSWSVDRGAHTQAFTFSSQDRRRLSTVRTSKHSRVLVCVCVLVCVRCGVCAESVWDVHFVFWCCRVLCCVVMYGVGAGVGVRCVVSVVWVRVWVARLGTRKIPRV